MLPGATHRSPPTIERPEQENYDITVGERLCALPYDRTSMKTTYQPSEGDPTR